MIAAVGVWDTTRSDAAGSEDTKDEAGDEPW